MIMNTKRAGKSESITWITNALLSQTLNTFGDMRSLLTRWIKIHLPGKGLALATVQLGDGSALNHLHVEVVLHTYTEAHRAQMFRVSEVFLSSALHTFWRFLCARRPNVVDWLLREHMEEVWLMPCGASSLAASSRMIWCKNGVIIKTTCSQMCGAGVAAGFQCSVFTFCHTFK